MQVNAAFRSALEKAVKPSLSAQEESKVLLLSCVDYRYSAVILETMEELGYAGRYYHLAMAGGAHAANPSKHGGNWYRTFYDHLAFAIDEAKVKGLVILDHLDCRAYQLYEGVPEGDLIAEHAKHVEIANVVVAEVIARYPLLQGSVTVLLLPPETDPEQIASA